MTLTGISMLVVALDQFTKFLVLKSMVLNQSIPLFPDVLCFTYIQNTGSAFGFMANLGPAVRIPFFIAATLLASFIVFTYQKMLPQERIWARIALGLVWGGALGNLVDRLLYGKVVDFIDAKDLYFPFIFNVADTCITVGLLYLLFEFIAGNRKKTTA
jgi:signal peptidase II